MTHSSMHSSSTVVPDLGWPFGENAIDCAHVLPFSALAT